MSRWRGPFLAMVLTAIATGAAAIVATPRIIMSIAVDRMIERGSANAFVHPPLTTPDNQTIVRPSPDLAYSACPFDLSGGPLRIDVTPVPGHYSSLSVFDGRTDVIFVRNDVQAQGRPYRVVLALPHHRVADSATVVRTDMERGVALIRLLLQNPTDLPKLQAARRLTRCRSIGAL